MTILDDIAEDRDKQISEIVAAAKRQKFCYVGAPAIFKLEQACSHINDAFGDFGCYVVGSSLERADFRDVDVRFIMKDEKYDQWFPGVGNHWEQDPRWLLLTVSISQWLSSQTGLPIDFQIQRQSHANERHKGMRHPIGCRFSRRGPADFT